MIKNIKTIAEAKAKCLNQKDGKQKYVVVEQWLKMFKKWYSPSGNEYTATLPAVEIYSYIAGFNEQGQECYATQKTLANIGMVSDRQVRNIINMFVDMGVLSVEARDGQTSLYKALPFTDAHITPPGESSLSDLSEAEEAQEQP
ncbi:helix-turn-helix domain-containing protein, partial [Escherichia coli]|uniref:helix-turn-helix domain-containing protein n=2 Tax=Escherichia coli TaxID=562 RepID=UPI001FF2F10A